MFFESIYRYMQVPERKNCVEELLILTINPILLTPKDSKMLSKEPMGFLKITCLNFSSEDFWLQNAFLSHSTSAVRTQAFSVNLKWLYILVYSAAPFYFFFKLRSALDFSTLAFVVLKKKKKKFLSHSRLVTYFA